MEDHLKTLERNTLGYIKRHSKTFKDIA